MATYRLIHQAAGTGERVSSLSDLEFRVWVQYQLSADDFGVCPAEAVKLQGDNLALQGDGKDAGKRQKQIQAAIERLVAVGLCRVFADGRRRYLYQPDWQDWQRLKHFTATSLPPIPETELADCSPKTREVFGNFHPKIGERLRPHAGARDAHANANANANADAPATAAPRLPLGPIAPVAAPAPRPGPRRHAPGLITSPLDWDRQHGSHVAGFCDFVCLPQGVFDEFLSRVVHAGAPEDVAREQVTAWAESVRAAWAGKIPGADAFRFWRQEWEKTHGSGAPARGGRDVAAGLRDL